MIDDVPQMLLNILEQPQVARDCLAYDLTALGAAMSGIKRVVFAACGSSRHAGLVAQLWMTQLGQRSSQTEDAANWQPEMLPTDYFADTDLVCCLSQSGMTVDVLTVAAAVRSRFGPTLAIGGMTNGANTKLHQIADIIVQTPAGEERSVAATKTVMAQLILLLRMALETRPIESPSLDLTQLPAQIQTTIDGVQLLCQSIAASIVDCNHLILLGSGVNYPIALEGALKLKETCYLHAEALSDGDFMHGPIAVIAAGFPVVLIAIPGDPNYANTIAHGLRIQSYGADLIVVTTGSNPDGAQFNRVLPIADIDPVLSPLLTLIPLQLLAYYLATARGLAVDQPRHLTKFIG
jgi:glutamine---fructose-6-phosphate transaminase (isomerizing)